MILENVQDINPTDMTLFGGLLSCHIKPLALEELVFSELFFSNSLQMF